MYPRVMAYAMRRTMDRSRADEVAAETFVVAWRRRRDRPGDELSWLLGVARRVLANQRRGDARREALDGRVLAEWRGGGDPSDGVGEREAILTALSRLGAADRELLILLCWDGLDRGQASAVLGCSRAALAVRLHRARSRFGRLLVGGGSELADFEPVGDRP